MRTKEEIDASANLLGDVINMFVRASYTARQNSTILNELTTGISAADSANDRIYLHLMLPLKLQEPVMLEKALL